MRTPDSALLAARTSVIDSITIGLQSLLLFIGALTLGIGGVGSCSCRC